MSRCISLHGEYSDHEFTPEQGEFICARCDVLDEDAALAEIERLRQWKAEALPVLAGLQELGNALGVPLGARITGPEAAERARELMAERDALAAGAVDADHAVALEREAVAAWLERNILGAMPLDLIAAIRNGEHHANTPPTPRQTPRNGARNDERARKQAQ